MQILQASTLSEHPQHLNSWTDQQDIVHQLQALGIQYQALALDTSHAENIDSPEQLAALFPELPRLFEQHHIEQIFVIPCNTPSQRANGLEEQQYDTRMIQVVLQGELLFAVRLGDRVYEGFCQAGDALVLPPSATFWFDLGEEPDAVILRALPAEIQPRAQRTGAPWPAFYSRLG